MNRLPIILFFISILHSLSLSVSADETGLTTKLWYEDRDRDGFGNPLVSIADCEVPEGFVANNRDCNDNPQERGTLYFPGAKEPCNYDDYNCDGLVEACEAAPDGEAISPQRDAFEVSSFQAGHPFKASPGGLHNLNDKSDFYPGMAVGQSAYIQTKGNGEITVLRAKGLAPFDFSGVMPKIWIKVGNISRLKDLSFYMGNNNLSNYARYNLKSNQGQKWITEGDWVSFTMPWNESDMSKLHLQPGVNSEDLRRNITDFQFRVVDDQAGEVKLHVNRISAVREEREKYPQGVISITFDDNWESQYIHARPKLLQYGFSATAYVIVGFLDTPNYMSTAQLRELMNDANWEVGPHAFDPVMHLQAYTNFSPDIVERDILAGRQWLWENGFGYGKDGRRGIAHFAYPKGEFKQPGSTDVLSIVRRHFSSARTIHERHRESVPPSDPHKLRVLYITASESVESVVAKIEEGIKAGEWIILVLHDLVEFPQKNDQWEIEKFNALVDYLGTRQPLVPIRTVGDVLGESY